MERLTITLFGGHSISAAEIQSTTAAEPPRIAVHDKWEFLRDFTTARMAFAMIILDTNVVSELMRPTPDQRVEAWLAAKNGMDVYLTAVTEAELRFGSMDSPEERRLDALAAAFDLLRVEDCAGRILPFGRKEAKSYALIAGERRAAGRSISQFDCQITAIATASKASLATRGTRDIDLCDVEPLNPWTR